MPTLVDQMLEENCIGLSSTKVTERKKCVEKVFELLEKRDVITLLNDNGDDGITWSNVVRNLHLHLIKEAEKLHEEERKKRNKSFYRQKGPDLLIDTIRKANTGRTRLTVTALIEYVLCCFTTPSLVKYFADTYVLILKDAVLSDSRYYGEIEEQEWMDLLRILKSNINNSKCDGGKVIECLELLLKWGPLHKLPLVQLRNEFPFITDLGLSLMKHTPKRHQEVILKILIEFCNQHCRDCCLACCKLGETVFRSLRTIYEVRTTENTIKNLMLEFFLLQVKLHHPNGSAEGSSSAYAHSWCDWNKQLRTLHHIIQEELNYSLVCSFKSNNAPFCYNQEKRMYPVFAEFVIRVLKQVFSCNFDDEMDISLPSLNITQPSAKKPRTELGMAALIADVQESKTWQWINIITEILRNSPEILTPEDFLRLLRVLCSLQSECKDSDVLSHIYECLYVLLDIEKCLDVSPEVHQMWSTIWDFAIRSAGLNQNIDVTHRLLQKLITQEKIRNDAQLFEAYTSGALAVNKQSLATLRTVSSVFGMPEAPSIRKKLLNWILNVDVDKCDPDTFVYGEGVTAEVLVMLCMKQWHLHCELERKDEVDFDVETVYLMNAFEHELILRENEARPKENALKSYVVNPELLEALLLMLETITSRFIEFVEGDLFALNVLNFLMLTSHTLSFLIKYKVITADGFDGIARRLHFEEMISNAQESLLSFLSVRVTLHFKTLLSADVCCFVSHKIRGLIQNEFVEHIYNRLSMDVEDDSYSNNYEKEICVDFLCSFCCARGSSEITNNQNYVLTMLSRHSFDVEVPKFFKMVMIIVNSLGNYKPGTVPDDVLQNVLEYLLEICRIFYTQYEVVLNVLVTFSDLLKHFTLTNEDDLKKQTSFFLENFYNLRNNYGPKVSLVLIKCMRQISEVNPVDAKWDGVHIPLLIARFLKSDYEEVRLAAIRQLLFVFRLSSHDNGAVYRLQKQIFDDVNVMSREVFRLEMTQPTIEQRKIDETVTRTATVLYTYGALMVVNSMWRRKALYSIIELVYEKKLNTGFLLKLLDMVVRNLKIQNVKVFLDEHIDYLLQQWQGHNHALSDFPHEFLGCLTENDFYDQYCHVVTPILVESQDVDGIDSVAQHKGKSVAEVVEISFPRIMALSLLKGASDGTTLQNLLGVSDLSELLLKKIDYVILDMIQSVFDVETIKEQLGFQYDVMHEEENYFSLTQFTAGMTLIEEQLSINMTIIEHCINLFPDKIQSVALKLTVAIHKASGLEDKLKALHHYTIFINLLTPFLKNKLKEFLVKHVTYSLLHIVTGGGDDTTSLAACNYLEKFCQKILPNCAEEMEALLFVVVNKLIPLASLDNQLGHACVNALDFLIVENQSLFKDAIESLDPFPQTEAFKKVNEVKRPRGQCHLQDDIRHFLEAGGDLTGNIGSRREALRCLKLQLAAKKNELKSLYDALQDVRGFYEDCKDSLLHRLIAMLVRLTASSDTEVSLEATRCLGEIGPADLTTVILQPRTTLEDSRSAPLQFTMMFVIQSLCEYAVDADIEVVQVSSQTLYDVLDTKEAKVIIDGSRTNAYAEVQRGFLTPFLTKRKLRGDSVVDVDMGAFQAKIDDVSLWYPARVEHELWIRTLVCALLECFTNKSYLSKLIPMCKVKVSFCEQLFPYLIYLIMHHANPTCVNIISKCMDDFFDRVWRLTLLDNQASAIQKSSVHCMLNVVHFTRLQTSVNSKKIALLSINYLKVAQAAYFCSTYFSALLYVELWCQAVIARLRNLGKNSNSASTTLDVICRNENEEVCENLQAILRRTYTALGDLDALNGCGYMHLLDTEKRIGHYKELGKWEQVVLHYDIQTAHNSHKYFPELSDALKNCQLYNLALNYNQSKGEVDYECFWRLNRYTDVNKANNKNSSHGGQYMALKSLCENDFFLFTESITSARNSVIEYLKNASLEGTKGLYDSLSQLRCIQELEEVHTAKQNNNFDELFEKWKEQDKLAKGDFKYIEPIKAQRISMLKKLLDAGFVMVKNVLVDAYLNLSGLAREECDFKIANWAMENLSLLPDLSEEYKALKMYEESQIYWSTGVKPIAKFIVNHLLEHNEENLRLRFACLKLYGKWMVETRSENPRTILHNYLLNALNVMRDVEKTPKDCEDIFDTYDVIARFADAEYQRILSYIKSSEFERKVKNMDKSRTTAQKIQTQSHKRPNIDEKRAMIIYKQQSMIDETEIERTYKEKGTYLIFAAKYYLLNLQNSDSNNTRIFRIFSLWLDNRSNSELTEIFEKFLPKIPSYKYISILPQLVPHLNNNNEEEFAKKICSIIERCCKDHPHHTLPILLALANSNKDDDYSPVVATTESNEPRVLGAQKLLQNLKQEPTLLKLITNMENVSEALLELAYLEDEKCRETGKGELVIPSRARITKIKNLSDVLLPTCTLEFSKARNYSNIVGIHSFGKEYVSLCGINKPKKVTCRGTDGVVRTQLVKGKDDLRQDAVMQQVFTIMNTLLRSNKQTSKLLIRTYKVVPLSRRSGILEWVENSLMIGEFLAHAHKKYNTGDWSIERCKQAIKEAQRASNEMKLQKFELICKNFRPIMHKFFEVNFPQPVIWYERRRAYMHSVATSSMCGYILGLGDRHVLNILIDKTTAEVIHIDFGIAFEQGRMLPTPETVPFRLTRDIEDGMGVSGIEGVFRRSCEKTMEVLRQNSETIVTILEVLLYDPLYAWTITPAEAYSRQFSDEDDSNKFSEEEKVPVNVSAERALLKLRQKLQGMEEGSTTSVEGQVEKLLQEARDYANLSRLYFGWQAFL